MNTDSQRLQIQRLLASGQSITPLQALRRFGCLSLSQRCTELRKQGWPILTKLVKVGRSRVAEYSIDTSKKRKS